MVVMEVDCIHVNTLFVILYENFTRCYHNGRLDKGHMGCLCVISYNCMSRYNYLNIKSLFKIYDTNFKIMSHNFIFYDRLQPFPNDFHAMEFITIKYICTFQWWDHSFTLIEIRNSQKLFEP